MLKRDCATREKEVEAIRDRKKPGKRLNASALSVGGAPGTPASTTRGGGCYGS